MSERWESSSDFNGNLGPAETGASIAQLHCFYALFCIVSKSSDPDGYELPCLCVRTQQNSLLIRGGRGG